MKIKKVKNKGFYHPSTAPAELKQKKYAYYVMRANKKDILGGFVKFPAKGDVLDEDFGKNLPNGIIGIDLPKNIVCLADGSLKTLKNVKYLFLAGSSITKLNDSELKGGDFEKLTLPQVEVLPYNLCDSCKNLKEVVIPKTVKKIESYAFANCSSLSIISLPNNVETINNEAFARTAIESIFLPASLNYLRLSAFEKCPNLKRIHFPEFNPNLTVSTYGSLQEEFTGLNEETWIEILKYNAKAIELIPEEKLYDEKFEKQCIDAIIEGKKSRASKFGITEDRMKEDIEDMDYVTNYLQEVKERHPDKLNKKMEQGIQKFKNREIINPPKEGNDSIDK